LWPGPLSQCQPGRLPVAIEAGVASAGCDQLVMGAALDDPAAVDNDDLVRVAHGAQPVGDDDAGASAEEHLHGALDAALALGVDAVLVASSR